jgi:hypothetical protein
LKSAQPFLSRFAIRSIVTCFIAILPAMTFAQSTAHYPAGIEGIEGASLPPPGLYLRDYNVAYTSSRLNDSSGNEAGMTWYPDADRKWELSPLNRYEINGQPRDTHTTPDDASIFFDLRDNHVG